LENFIEKHKFDQGKIHNEEKKKNELLIKESLLTHVDIQRQWQTWDVKPVSFPRMF